MARTYKTVEGASGVTGRGRGLIALCGALDANGADAGEVVVAVSGLAAAAGAADDDVGGERITGAVGTFGHRAGVSPCARVAVR